MKNIRKYCFVLVLIFGGLAILNGLDILATKLRTQVYAASGQKIVTIYDKTARQTVLTDKTTVNEVIEQAKIELGKFDIVEPALETEISDGFNVNIFRARPLTVVDGDSQIKIMTPYQLASDIAKVAGIELFPEDVVEFDYDEMGLHLDVGPRMIIKRATAFKLNFFGKESVVRTQAKTVGEFLQNRQIELKTNDKMNLDANTIITADLKLEIWQEGEQEITSEEEIKFTTRKILNHEKEVGFSEIQQKGINGKRLVTYKIEIKNGVEVSRQEVNSVTLTEATEQVEIVGMKRNAPKYTGGGNKNDWLTASGIPQEYWGYVDAIVSKESGWNPNAENKSSGACGLAQALPCSKVGGNGGFDPVSSLQWMNGYVFGRYYDGSPYAAGLCGGKARGWECAWTFWQVKKWY